MTSAGPENGGPENAGLENGGPDTTDMTDKCRLDNDMAIRRPRRKIQQRNEIRLQACLDKYDDGTYTRIQYLRAVSHSIAHTDSLQLPDGTIEINLATKKYVADALFLSGS